MINERGGELSAGVAQTREAIAAAAERAGRAADEVTLIAVTKYFPASDVRLLDSLGVAHVGENKQQELIAKAAECRDLSISWNYIGGLQSNKAAAVARVADAVHSVDRAKLVPKLARGAADRPDGPLAVFIQVSLDPPGADEGRQGVEPDQLLALAEQIGSEPDLNLCGVMGVAPRGLAPGPAFAQLREHSARLVEEHPGATRISAGMSGDFEEAIAHGATHVRIGARILGPRPPMK